MHSQVMLKYCGTKLEVITTTNQTRETQHNKPMRTGLKHKKPWVAKTHNCLYFLWIWLVWRHWQSFYELIMTEFLILFSYTVSQFDDCHLFLIWRFFGIYHILHFFFPFLLGGLPLCGAYDSFVDYPNNNVVNCHWIVINK